jgi:hypothetical protein
LSYVVQFTGMAPDKNRQPRLDASYGWALRSLELTLLEAPSGDLQCHHAGRDKEEESYLPC